MSSAKITLMGLTNFDNSLFDDLVLPAGIDKDLFVNSLLLKGGEFETLYPDPEFMRYSIAVWGRKWYRTFAEWLKGTEAEWNPIYNYDRFEESEDKDNRTYGNKTTADYSDNRTANLEDKRTANLEDKRTANLTDRQVLDLRDDTQASSRTTTTQKVAGTTQHDVSAYDAGNFTPSSRDTVNNGTTQTDGNSKEEIHHRGTDSTTHTGTDTNTQTGTDTTAHTGTDNIRHTGTLSDVTGTDNNTNNHKAHIYGNIGVTQASDMLRSFYDIASWSLYDHMSDVFIGELLIPVY